MTVLTLQPAAFEGLDTSLSQGNPDTSYATQVYFLLSAAVGGRGTGLLKFDLSAIPEDSTIDSAVLSLFGSGSGFNASLSFHRILPANAAWTEGVATWNFLDGVSRWAGDTGADGGTDAGCSVAGTDYAAAALGTMSYNRTLGTERQSAFDPDEFALVFADNNGIVIRDATGNWLLKQPCSSDHGTAAYRPKLVVTYTAPIVVVPDAPIPVCVTAPQFLVSEQNFPFTC